jgi:hypothetical protein
MLTKEISEVEKGCGKRFDTSNDMNVYFCGERVIEGIDLCPICQAKLSTLKSAQAKFDKFVDKIINHIDLRNQQLIDNDEGISTDNMLKTIIYQEMKVFIKELSSKQEGKAIKNKNIFNRALTPEEIEELYEKELSSKQEKMKGGVEYDRE